MAESDNLVGGGSDVVISTTEDRQKNGGIQVADESPPEDRVKSGGAENESASVNDAEQKNDCMEQDSNNDAVTEGNLNDSFKENKKDDDSMQDDEMDTSKEQDADFNGNRKRRQRSNSLTLANNLKKKNRRKGRGGKNHRKNNSWRPYCTLTWQERQKVDEKETRRATKKRDDQFKSGQPMAPYNTTQFLMNDQDQPSPQMSGTDHGHREETASTSHCESSDGEYYSEPSDEDSFVVQEMQEFEEEYSQCQSERLQKMSKDEIINEYIELQAKYEKNEELVKTLENGNGHRSSSEREARSVRPVANGHRSSMEKELEKLREELTKLKRENEFLKAAAGEVTKPRRHSQDN